MPEAHPLTQKVQNYEAVVYVQREDTISDRKSARTLLPLVPFLPSIRDKPLQDETWSPTDFRRQTRRSLDTQRKGREGGGGRRACACFHKGPRGVNRTVHGFRETHGESTTPAT